MTFLEGSKTEVFDATIVKHQWNDRAQITSDVITKPQAYETKKTVLVDFSVQMLAMNSFEV